MKIMAEGLWKKDIAMWHIGRTRYISVPFTWLLPSARKLALEYKKGPVQVGGPAVQLMPEYLADAAVVNQPCPVEPMLFHNPLATFTSRGCPNRCGFCAVPRLEGEFKELDDWRLAPIICDNKLLASSRGHFNRVIDRLKTIPDLTTKVQPVDFNQGLEARLLKPHHARRLAELKRIKVRFAFDHVNAETAVYEAIKLCRAHGLPLKSFSVYVLIGFKDTPEDALYRLDKVKSWGVYTCPMRYQPLDSVEKNNYAADGWTDRLLKDVVRFYYKNSEFGNMPFSEYNSRPMPLLQGLVDTP